MAQMRDETGLDKNAANFVALTPLSHLKRASYIFPDRLAVAYGTQHRKTYAEYHARVSALASALSARIPIEGLGDARSHLRMTNTTWHQNYVQRSQNFPCYRTFPSAPSIADVTTRGIHPRFAPAKCVLRTILWGAICKARATTEGNTESVQIVDLVHQYVPDLVPTGAIFYWRHLIWSSLNALLTEQVLSKWPWSPRC